MLIIRDSFDTFCLPALDGCLGFLLVAFGGSIGFTSGALGGSSVFVGVLLGFFWDLLGFVCFLFECLRRLLGAPLASFWQAFGVIWDVSGFVWLPPG